MHITQIIQPARRTKRSGINLRPIHFLAAVIVAPIISWPATWAIMELQKILNS